LPDIQDQLDQHLFDIIVGHLAKLGDYVPGPVKKAGGTKGKLKERYASDPLFNIFGLDSPEYVAATLAGGTITSIHRKLGDIYEQCVQAVFMNRLKLSFDQINYSATIRSGDENECRSADACLLFEHLEAAARKRIKAYCEKELRQLTDDPRIELIGVGMEIRHCYQTGDSKRTQADEALARHFLVSGILPLMPLFCNQSNPTIIRRYRSVWIIKQGMESYKMVKKISGYDLFSFMERNKDEFRKPVLTLLKGLSK